MSESEGRGGHNKINRDELLRALAELHDELGEVPRLKDWRERGAYSAKALYNEFDSWNAALDALDMEKHHVVNKERLTFQCDNPGCDESVEKTAAVAEQSDYHYCSQDCHYAHKSERYSGDDNPVSTLKTVKCHSCGDEFQRPKWKREANERHYCSRACFKKKKQLVCEQCGDEFTVIPALSGQRFCSYDCMGEWRSQVQTGEDHPRWRGGYDVEYYGPNWLKQRREAIVRDQARCVDCGLPEHKSWELFGEGLSVHHKQPIRTYRDGDELDYKSANRLSNLVSLCRPCHSKRETESPLTDF